VDHPPSGTCVRDVDNPPSHGMPNCGTTVHTTARWNAEHPTSDSGDGARGHKVLLKGTTHHDQIVALAHCDIVCPVALRTEVRNSPALDMTILATELPVSRRADTTTKSKARSFKFTTQTDIERHVRIVGVPVHYQVAQHSDFQS